MIVKIIPIYNYAGLKRCTDYVANEEKVIQSEIQKDINEINFSQKNGIANVLEYAADEGKIKKKYRSGYLCDPDFAVNEFEDIREKSLLRLGKYSPAAKNEIVGYHIIQSFEDELDISDDEVHQCGLEFMEKFCQKFGEYQGVVNSHLNPTVDEKGIVHGKQKHNHIIINAYGLDPEKQYGKDTRKIKYHDCNENKEKLRKINDEIAVAHGLPIILNPDNDKNNSWKEAVEAKSGNSWKENIRRDIDNMKLVCNTWGDFVSGMKAAGYFVAENKYVTYTMPDGEHKVRDKTLGREYTRETLEKYWTPLENIKDTSQIVAEELQKLSDESAKNGKNLYVKITINNETLKQNNYSFNIPLDKKIDRKDTYNSYFDTEKFYRVYDKNKHIMTVSGRTLRLYFEQKNTSERKQEREYTIKGRYFYNAAWTDTKNKRPYRIGLYDSGGRRRSLTELILLLAIQILSDKQNGAHSENKSSAHIRTDWKLQNMINAVTIARDGNVRTDAELTEKLNIAGKTCSCLKARMRKNDSVYNRLETLNKTLSEFLSVKDFCESMIGVAMSGRTPEEQREYAEKIGIYKRAKAVLYKYNLTDEESIEEFKKRFKYSEDLKARLSDEYSAAAKNYGDLKKLQHQLDAARDWEYIYEKKDIKRKQDRNGKEFEI